MNKRGGGDILGTGESRGKIDLGSGAREINGRRDLLATRRE
jgi:hypothetical protein